MIVTTIKDQQEVTAARVERIYAPNAR